MGKMTALEETLKGLCLSEEGERDPEKKETPEDDILVGKGKGIKLKEWGRRGQLDLGEAEACWVTQEEDRQEKDWVEIV